MRQICSRVAFLFSAQKYQIKQFTYLIEAPPSRPGNSYTMYVTATSTGTKGKLTKEGGQKWKALGIEEKQVYSKKYEELSKIYQQAKEAYISKYVNPFKRASALILYSVQVAKTEVLEKGKQTDYIKRIGEKIKAGYAINKQQYAKEAEAINKVREAQRQKFKFPTRQYHTRLQYSRAHPKIQPKIRAKAYRSYIKEWEQSVANWLAENKINLDIKGFLRLYNKELRKVEKKKVAKKEAKQEAKLESEKKEAEASGAK